jgi:hypothetical protein
MTCGGDDAWDLRTFCWLAQNKRRLFCGCDGILRYCGVWSVYTETMTRIALLPLFALGSVCDMFFCAVRIAK